MSDDATELVRLVARFLRQVQLRREAVPADISETLRAAGLGIRHLSVLIGLAVRGPLTVGALAEHIALAPASTSQLVGELHRAGLVERRIDPADRRRVVIAVDEQLRPRVAALAEQRLNPLKATLARLTEREREHFLHGWRVLVDMHERRVLEE